MKFTSRPLSNLGALHFFSFTTGRERDNQQQWNTIMMYNLYNSTPLLLLIIASLQIMDFAQQIGRFTRAFVRRLQGIRKATSLAVQQQEGSKE
jgi:hypothetical protein